MCSIASPSPRGWPIPRCLRMSPMQSKRAPCPYSARYSVRFPLPVLPQHNPFSDPRGGNAMFHAAFQGTIIRNQPVYRPRPDTMPGYHKFTNGNYDAFVAHSALEEIAWRAREAAPNEMIGHLLGRPFRDAKGSYAVVTAAIIAESARCGPATVETTLDDEQGLLQTLLVDHPLTERLGWFHSHPFAMAKYSPTDRENQRFWSEPYQLGLLAYLGRDGGVGIIGFRGPESEAIHPAYTASLSAHSNRVPAFRPLRETETRKTTPKAPPPTKRTTRRHFSDVLLTLAVGIIWPVVFLMGVSMIVQAMREGRDSASQTVITAKEEEPPAGQVNTQAPVKATNPEAANVAAQEKSVEHPDPKTSPTGK